MALQCPSPNTVGPVLVPDGYDSDEELGKGEGSCFSDSTGEMLCQKLSFFRNRIPDKRGYRNILQVLESFCPESVISAVCPFLMKSNRQLLRCNNIPIHCFHASVGLSVWISLME